VLDPPAPLHDVTSLADGDRVATADRGAVTALCACLAAHHGQGHVGWIQSWVVPLLRGLEPKSAQALLAIFDFIFLV
jgi:hypothetical protein